MKKANSYNYSNQTTYNVESCINYFQNPAFTNAVSAAINGQNKI